MNRVSTCRVEGDAIKAYFWIPYFHLQWSILDLLEQHRLGPCPFVHDSEELANNNRPSRLRVQLTDSCDQHRPRNTARESDNVRVDRATLSPQFDGAQGETEGFLLGNELKNLVRDTGPIERADFLFIQPSQIVIVLQIQVHGH